MDWSDFLDQVLHITWGFAVGIVYWLSSGLLRMGPMAVLGGASAALVLALPRELVDQWPIDRPLDTVIDTTFFLVGGSIAGLTAWGVSKHDRS